MTKKVTDKPGWDPYLVMHLPQPARTAMQRKLTDWQASPTVQDRLLTPRESRAHAHVSVVYNVKAPSFGGVPAPQPMKLRLGQHLKYFGAEGRWVAVMPVAQGGGSLRRLQQKLKETVPNTHRFSNFEPHVTVAYLSKKLEPADEASLVKSLGDMHWTQRQVECVDEDNRTLARLPFWRGDARER